MKITNVTAAIIHRDGKIIIAQRDLAGYFGGFSNLVFTHEA